MERLTTQRELLALRLFQGADPEAAPVVSVRSDLQSVGDVSYAIIALAVAEADLLANIARDPRVPLDDLRTLVDEIRSIQAPTQRALDERHYARAGRDN